jgi:hypothetical protein
MKKKNNYKGFFGIIAFAAVLMFALSGCGDSDEGGNPDKPNNPNLPTALKNTNWIHTSGDKVQFGTNNVTVIPAGGSSRSFTLKSSVTVSELSQTTLYFGDSQTSDFIVYRDGTISSVGLGGVQRTGGWSRDTGGGPQPNQCTITFNADGGTVSPASKQVNSGSPAGDLPVPENSPSFFGGWYTAQNGGGDVFTSGTVVTASITVYAKWVAETNIGSIASYLIAQSGGSSTNNPINLPITLQLTEANWLTILSSIDSAGKYVALDISLCIRSTANTGGGLRSNGDFDPIRNLSTGKSRIVSLILPNASSRIASASGSDAAFKSFSNLTSVSASSVISIAGYTFHDCTRLTSANFPVATSIGEMAFWSCTSLPSVNFPAVTQIDGGAFYKCTSLTSLSFPKVTSIGKLSYSGTFEGCIRLTSVNFPALTTIRGAAFDSCTNLTTVSFPASVNLEFNNSDSHLFMKCPNLVSIILTGTGHLSTIEDGKALVRNNTELVAYPSASGNITLNTVTSIGRYAFNECTSLISVNLPVATDISKLSFNRCTGLTSLNLPSATRIGDQVLSYTGATALTINLGSSAPTLEGFMFDNSAKTVTVKVPTGATGYDDIPATYSGTDTTENWGNGFRGGGWDGSGFVEYGSVNSNITLYVQYQE